MKHRLLPLLLVACVSIASPEAAAAEKLRVLVLTDIENEPDDAMSMVRFLTYTNQWDVEGLVATTSVHQKDKTAAWRIREIVAAYGKVRDNLEKHEPGYPTADYLLSIIREGRPAYGMGAVGEGMDSPGSDLIVQAVDRDDPRPVWVTVWGGPNCLAQALWKVRAHPLFRSAADVRLQAARLHDFGPGRQRAVDPEDVPRTLLHRQPRHARGWRVPPRHVEWHQRRQLPRSLRRRRLQPRRQPLARSKYPQQRAAGCRASANEVPDGGRQPELSLSRCQRTG